MTPSKLMVATLTGVALVIFTGSLWLVPPQAIGGDIPHPQMQIDGRRAATGVQSFALDNGLRVVAVPATNAERLLAMVWYGVGSADDPSDRPGLAHYAEHVTFSALGIHDEVKSRRARRDGGLSAAPGAFTSKDYTAYYHLVEKAKLSAALQLEASRMSRLRIDQAAVEAERMAVLHERKHDIESDPHALLEEKIQSAVFLGTSYGRPVVAPEAETRRISAEDVRDFLHRWYVPSNSIVIIIGDIGTPELERVVEAAFGQIASRQVPERKREAPTPPAENRIVEDAARASERQWARTYAVRSFATGSAHDVAALQLLSGILANDHSGLLYRPLVRDRRLAKDVSVEYVPEALGATGFTIQAVLARGADLRSFERALEAEIEKIVTLGVSEDDMAKAREKVEGDLAKTWGDAFEAGSAIGTALTTGRQLDAVINWRQPLAEIAPEHIRQAAQHVFATRIVATGVTKASAE
jgi:zinc protease